MSLQHVCTMFLAHSTSQNLQVQVAMHLSPRSTGRAMVPVTLVHVQVPSIMPVLVTHQAGSFPNAESAVQDGTKTTLLISILPDA